MSDSRSIVCIRFELYSDVSFLKSISSIFAPHLYLSPQASGEPSPGGTVDIYGTASAQNEVCRCAFDTVVDGHTTYYTTIITPFTPTQSNELKLLGLGTGPVKTASIYLLAEELPVVPVY